MRHVGTLIGEVAVAKKVAAVYAEPASVIRMYASPVAHEVMVRSRYSRTMPQNPAVLPAAMRQAHMSTRANSVCRQRRLLPAMLAVPGRPPLTDSAETAARPKKGDLRAPECQNREPWRINDSVGRVSDDRACRVWKKACRMALFMHKFY